MRSSTGSQKHRIAMKVEEVFLALRKGTDINQPFGFDSHPLEGRLMCYRREDQLPGVLKSNEAAVEQMVNAGCQK
jgi:hypothetical protein